jgi:hypothetical protein
MKYLSLILGLTLISAAYADTPPSLGSLKKQATALQQAIDQQNQNSQATLTDLQNQLTALNTQIARLASPDLKKFNWALASDTLPQNAVVVAQNGTTPLYACQATYTGSSSYSSTVTDPGVVTPDGCVISFAGQAYVVPQYSILVSSLPGFWVDGSKIQAPNSSPPVTPLMLVRTGGGANKNTPANTTNQPTPLYNQLAIVGGNENGNDVYICRVNINNQYFIGKGANGTCFIAVGSGEASWPKYEVLLAKQPAGM